MASPDAPKSGRNIVIFSDGTGQRGGLYFDEERTNIYKLYRATRVAPDSSIKPDVQLAFYDPGLGTLSEGGGTIDRFFRRIYNFISQATGLGITRNIIDCYAALIRLWQPGDRIFLFGFSRGAYTVRCLASVICMCGIPTSGYRGEALSRDMASSIKIATRAVKAVYQHVSSPRDQKYLAQRKTLAAAFRKDYSANKADDSPNAQPYFIGVFDTVASLSNTGSLVILCVLYALVHVAAAAIIAFLQWRLDPIGHDLKYWVWYWFAWFAVWAFCAAGAAYVYTHLKFAWRLPGFYFWDVIHLTDFRQKFYDQYLNPLVVYARHAISIDERRNDFKRVPWGGKHTDFLAGAHKIEPFEQLWFAGNHADIGGGYPENKSRLSDITLDWMISQASDPHFGGEGLVVDRSVLRLNGRADGMQHDETRNSVFRWTKKTGRDPVSDATLHPTVLTRFKLVGVQQYDVTAPYRPEALRDNILVAKEYEDIPLPYTTCWQCISREYERRKKTVIKTIDCWLGAATRCMYPKDWRTEDGMSVRKLTPDSIVSCLGLALLILFVGTATWILLFWQIVPWLRDGTWHSYPISEQGVQISWVGAKLIIDWLLKLPLTLLLAGIGIFLFRAFGILSAKLYQWANRGSNVILTPSQTHA